MVWLREGCKRKWLMTVLVLVHRLHQQNINCQSPASAELWCDASAAVANHVCSTVDCSQALHLVQCCWYRRAGGTGPFTLRAYGPHAMQLEQLPSPLSLVVGESQLSSPCKVHATALVFESVSSDHTELQICDLFVNAATVTWHLPVNCTA